MYILFPIGIMYYFGTNLDQKFNVPDFWPEANQTHKIPFEKDEIQAELERLRRRRLAQREKRLAIEERVRQLQEGKDTAEEGVVVHENGRAVPMALREGESTMRGMLQQRAVIGREGPR